MEGLQSNERKISVLISHTEGQRWRPRDCSRLARGSEGGFGGLGNALRGFREDTVIDDLFIGFKKEASFYASA